jgi:hypothetical protein
MSSVSEAELRALRARYLAAYLEYDRYVAALSGAGLRDARSVSELRVALARALEGLKAARWEYREALAQMSGRDSPERMSET